MNTNTIAEDEWLDRAFQLAYFLHGDKATAAIITAGAMNKLALAAAAQSKRLYYKLTGRATSRKGRNKVLLSEPHLLQRLIYVESESFEREKERAAQKRRASPPVGHTNPQTAASDTTVAREADLLVYFVKHLVRITTKRNSFYVTLGLSRLLHSYTTSETMELYNLVVQDPDSVRDDYYYRSRKAVLLKELKERFGDLVQIAKGARGEERLQCREESSSQAALVSECLNWFTPWQTPCVVPQRFDRFTDTIAALNFTGRRPDEEHEVEVNRIHATLHPECFARLAAANSLAAPNERLELPHFFCSDEHDEDAGPPRNPPHVSSEELRTINNLLAQEATRRKASSAGFLRVMVDGLERAEIETRETGTARIFVDEGAEVIEIYGADQHGALLLATHLLNFEGPERQTAAITLERGQQISFTTNLSRDALGAATGAQVTVGYQETAGTPGVWSSVQHRWAALAGPARGLTLAPLWKPVATLATLALLAAGGWWLWSARKTATPPIVYFKPTPAPTITPRPAPPVMQTPQPQKSGTRSEPQPRKETSPNHNPSPAAQPTVDPPRHSLGGPDETFVARSIVPDANSEVGTGPGNGLRGSWDSDLMGKPLRKVQSVYVEAVGPDATRQKLQAELRRQLAVNAGVRLAEREQADAALKIFVRPASTRADEKRVIAIVRAVNATGYVVWPASRRGSSWRYVGRADDVAARIVDNLSSDLARARRRSP